jgi:hypothetical protein
MTDSGTMRFGWVGWTLAVAGLLLGSPGAALAASLPDLKVTALTDPPSTALPGESFAVTAKIKNGGRGSRARLPFLKGEDSSKCGSIGWCVLAMTGTTKFSKN